MSDRGNTTHRPELDEQLAHEAQSIVQGHGSNSHVEEFRQSEPVPDDTDGAETLRASGYDGEIEGELQDDATDTVAEDDADRAEPLPSGAGDGADATVYSTETGEGSTDGTDAE
jgi:hypothetical protein